MAWSGNTVTNLEAEVWSKELINRAKEKSIMMTRYAKGGVDGINAPINIVTDLKARKGGTVNYGLQPRAGYRTAYADHTDTKTGDTTLEGQEQDMTYLEDDVAVTQRRHAVKSDGKFFEQKICFDFRDSATEIMSTWLADDMDWEIVNAQCDPAGTGTDSLTHHASRVVYAGVMTSVADTLITDLMDLPTLFEAKLLAKRARMRPIKVDGGEYYLALLHPEVMHGLRTAYPSSSHEWFDTMMRAHVRGSDNPIFTGAFGIVDGIILAEHRDIHLADTWGAGSILRGAKNLFLGAQAGVWAWAALPTWVEKLFDYDNQLGVSTGYIAGTDRCTFGAVEFASIGIYCATGQAIGGGWWV